MKRSNKMRFLFRRTYATRNNLNKTTFDQEQTPAMLQLETGTGSHSAFLLCDGS